LIHPSTTTPASAPATRRGFLFNHLSDRKGNTKRKHPGEGINMKTPGFPKKAKRKNVKNKINH
jgi:hypothetical protein